MLKKTLAVILTITTLLALSACGLFPSVQTDEEVVTFDVSEFTETESEVETIVDTSGLDTTEAESSEEESTIDGETESNVVTTVDTTEDTTGVDTTEEDTAETQDSDESTIMSDEEAIELFMLYHSTSEKWRTLDIYTDTNTDDYIEYTSPDGTFSNIYYAIPKDYTSSLYEPDVRGNTEIRYGDNDWMQENLRTIFTEEFIQRYFNYEAPRPHLLYRDGKVYARELGGAGETPRHPKNYTILHKSENELAIMCETYSYHYETEENADKISGFWYMKLVKEDGLWLIDEHFSECADIRIKAKDRIPAEYVEGYQKYKDTWAYFWLKYYFEIPEEELAFDESKIIGTFKCIGDLVDGFPEEPEIMPYISFYEDGTCRLLAGYEGEKVYIDGTYTISGRETNVVFDVSNTPYSNWTGKRTTAFRFLEDDLMEIGYGVCDNVEGGYGFVRDDNMMEVTPINTTKNNTEI